MSQYIKLLDAEAEFPPELITCFNLVLLPIYQQAIDEYAKIVPDHKLVISTAHGWNCSNDPALLCYNSSDLSKFWEIFRSICKAYFLSI